jgi:hypothetical protein
MGRRILAGGVLRQRGQTDGGRACPDEGPNGRGRASIECKEVRDSVSGSAAAGDVTMPFTPEAQAKRAKIAAIYGWFRQRFVLLIVGAMLFLQFMTWRALDRLYIPSPPDCSYHSPCYVQGIVALDENSIRRISK